MSGRADARGVHVLDMMCHMRNEFTAIIEQDEGWFVAYALEVPGANGQGRTRDEALSSLAAAIELIRAAE